MPTYPDLLNSLTESPLALSKSANATVPTPPFDPFVAGEDHPVGSGLEACFDPNSPLVVFDTETTGLDHRTEKLIEIGAVKLLNGEVIDRFSTLINPEQPIRGSSFKIHHISEEMVADAPTIETVLPEFLAFIGDLPYAAHSAIFDYSFINEACKKHLGKRFTNPRICTLEMYKHVFPDEPSHGLSALAARFGFESHVSHRALDDAEQLARCYPILRDLYVQKHHWQFSQLGNVKYLVERYLRLQKAAHALHAEMSDLKDIFKLHFTEGGGPVKASSGEILSWSYKRGYDYDEESLLPILERNELLPKVSRLNLKTLDRMISNGKLKKLMDSDEYTQLLSCRTKMSQNLQVAFVKPSADAPLEAASVDSDTEDVEA